MLHAYVAALPAAMITTCRLHAGPAELRQRIMTRGEGGSWPQPGDPLGGQPASYLSRVAEQVAASRHLIGIWSGRQTTAGARSRAGLETTGRSVRGPHPRRAVPKPRGIGRDGVSPNRHLVTVRGPSVIVSRSGSADLAWLSAHSPEPPASYRKIVLIGDQKHPAVEGDPALPRGWSG